MNYKKNEIIYNYKIENIDLTKKHLYLFMGLPASGKTTEALKIYDMFSGKNYLNNRIDFFYITNCSEVVYIDGDSFDKDNLSNWEIDNLFKDKYIKVLIFDELFLNTNSILNILDFLESVGYEVDELRIIEFCNNINKCIYNDIIRNRDYKALNTIKNAELESFDEKLLQRYFIAKGKKFNYKIYKKNVEVADIEDYEKTQNTIIYLREKFDCSCEEIEIWNNKLKMLQSLGGNWQDDYLTPIDPDSVTVKQMYIDFLDLNFNSWFKYKTELFSIVEKREYNESDYYGGSIDYIEWEIDLGLLFGIAWALNLCDRDLFLTKDYSEWSKGDFLKKLNINIEKN